MWLVDSQCGIVWILLNFHMWTGVKNFRPESGVKFFIHEIFHTWNRCEFSIRHVQPCSTCEILNLHTFQTCFWCESGMKQAWSYENILYGSRFDHVNTIVTKQLCVLYASNLANMFMLTITGEKTLLLLEVEGRDYWQIFERAWMLYIAVPLLILSYKNISCCHYLHSYFFVGYLWNRCWCREHLFEVPSRQ